MSSEGFVVSPESQWACCKCQQKVLCAFLNSTVIVVIASNVSSGFKTMPGKIQFRPRALPSRNLIIKNCLTYEECYVGPCPVVITLGDLLINLRPSATQVPKLLNPAEISDPEKKFTEVYHARAFPVCFALLLQPLWPPIIAPILQTLN